MKTCTKCKDSYPATPEYFYRRHAGNDAQLLPRCKKCLSQAEAEWWAKTPKYKRRDPERHRQVSRRYYENHKEQVDMANWRWRLRKRLSDYGVTPEQWQEMHQRAIGHCEACGVKEPTRRLAVDHDHTSGRFRGFLCVRCNRLIGAASDEPALLRALAAYLERA